MTNPTPNGLLIRAHVTLSQSGHLVVHSLDQELHNALGLLWDITQKRLPLVTSHDGVVTCTTLIRYERASVYRHWAP